MSYYAIRRRYRIDAECDPHQLPASLHLDLNESSN